MEEEGVIYLHKTTSLDTHTKGINENWHVAFPH